MLWSLPRSIRRRPIRSLLAVFVIWTFLETILVRHGLYLATLAAEAQATLPSRPAPLRIYIASLHWNNEAILREFWNDAVVRLVHALGPSNVFINILGSGSWDNSKNALGELDRELDAIGVAREITWDETSHDDEISSPPAQPGNGWIKTSRGKIALRRIPYLARLRNKSLEPLAKLAENGTTFDYVLFLNDVYFTVITICPTLACRKPCLVTNLSTY